MTSRHRGAAAALACLLSCGILAGCGYMGDPLPPALKRPVRVTDLAAIEHGANIVIRFTLPTITTEGLTLKPPQENVDLRIGVWSGEFHIEDWLRDAEHIAVVPTEKSAVETPIPASKYVGKTVVIMVRVAGPSGRDAGWSNTGVVNVVPVLLKPEGLEAKDAPDAVELSWHAAAPEFRVFRKATDSPEWTMIATTSQPSYVDRTIDYGRTYQYFVQSIEKAGDQYAESDGSDPLQFKPYDKFPPAVPQNLSAVPGARTIELVWDRNTEKDLAGYRVYRNGQKVADGLTAPSYSDRDVQPGVTYQYQVSAVDAAENESAKSTPVSAAIPM